MDFNKIIDVDLDGTLVPGTEVRNRAALQGMVDHFTTTTGINRFKIPWDHCNGQDEQRIHAILVEQGLHGLPEHLSAPNFQLRAKEAYGEVTDVDLSPRPGMIDVLQYLKHYGVTPVLVTNSLRESAEATLKACFEIHSQEHGKLVSPADVFPLIVTKTDVLASGLQPKPSSDPFELVEKRLTDGLAHNHSSAAHYAPTEFYYPRESTLILEDSGTGTSAGFAHTGNKEQVIQFIDMASPCNNAGHHVEDMTGCVKAMCDFYGVPETKDVNNVRDTLMRIAGPQMT